MGRARTLPLGPSYGDISIAPFRARSSSGWRSTTALVSLDLQAIENLLNSRMPSFGLYSAKPLAVGGDSNAAWLNLRLKKDVRQLSIKSLRQFTLFRFRLCQIACVVFHAILERFVAHDQCSIDDNIL